MSGKSFIDVNVHWINDDFQGEKKILTVFKVDSKKAKDYRKVVDKVLDEHGIKRGLLFSRLIMNPQCEPHLRTK